MDCSLTCQRNYCLLLWESHPQLPSTPPPLSSLSLTVKISDLKINYNCNMSIHFTTGGTHREINLAGKEMVITVSALKSFAILPLLLMKYYWLMQRNLAKAPFLLLCMWGWSKGLWNEAGAELPANLPHQGKREWGTRFSFFNNKPWSIPPPSPFWLLPASHLFLWNPILSRCLWKRCFLSWGTETHLINSVIAR